jgi:hypothetical protein
MISAIQQIRTKPLLFETVETGGAKYLERSREPAEQMSFSLRPMFVENFGSHQG